MMKIWERYCLRQVAQIFFLFLICFFLLYVLIDYSSNSRDFARANLDWGPFAAYYICQFSKQLHLLVPFALLLAVIRTLTMMNTHHELTALLAGGLKRKVFMRPFLLLGFLSTLFVYANIQWVLPGTLAYLQKISDKHFESHRQAPKIHTLALRDQSVLLYQSYDTVRERFFDNYWVRSADDVYRIKYLYPEPHEALGQFVDHLKRDPSGRLVRVASYKAKVFPELGFDEDVLGSAVMNPQQLSITRLWDLLPSHHQAHSEKEALIVSAFHSKLAIPWLCMLVVIAPAPICLVFTRSLPVFSIFAAALGGFVIFLTFFDAMLILGEGLVIPPLVAAWGPFIPFFGYYSYRYIRMV